MIAASYSFSCSLAFQTTACSVAGQLEIRCRTNRSSSFRYGRRSSIFPSTIWVRRPGQYPSGSRPSGMVAHTSSPQSRHS